MNNVAIFVFWTLGTVLSAIGIVFDTVSTVKTLLREKSSSQYAELYYARFIFRLLNLANYGIQIGYCTDLIFFWNIPIFGVSIVGVLTECLVISVIIYYMDTRRPRLTMLFLVVIDLALVMAVLLGAFFGIPKTDLRRGKTVGIVSTATSIASLVAVMFDVRVIWLAHAVQELSVYGTGLGLSGTGSLCVYGILYSHYYIAARHGFAAGMYLIIGVVIAVHHFLPRSEDDHMPDRREAADGGEILLTGSGDHRMSGSREAADGGEMQLPRSGDHHMSGRREATDGVEMQPMSSGDHSMSGLTGAGAGVDTQLTSPPEPSLEDLLRIVDEDTRVLDLVRDRVRLSQVRLGSRMMMIEVAYDIVVDHHIPGPTGDAAGVETQLTSVPEPSDLQYDLCMLEEDTRLLHSTMARLTESQARLDERMMRIEGTYATVADHEDIGASTSTDVQSPSPPHPYISIDVTGEAEE